MQPRWRDSPSQALSSASPRPSPRASTPTASEYRRAQWLFRRNSSTAAARRQCASAATTMHTLSLARWRRHWRGLNRSALNVAFSSAINGSRSAAVARRMRMPRSASLSKRQSTVPSMRQDYPGVSVITPEACAAPGWQSRRRIEPADAGEFHTQAERRFRATNPQASPNRLDMANFEPSGNNPGASIHPDTRRYPRPHLNGKAA